MSSSFPPFFLDFNCSDNVYGAGDEGDVRNGDCPKKNMVGYLVAKCTSGKWNQIEDNCVLRVFQIFKDAIEVI